MKCPFHKHIKKCKLIPWDKSMAFLSLVVKEDGKCNLFLYTAKVQKNESWSCLKIMLFPLSSSALGEWAIWRIIKIPYTGYFYFCRHSICLFAYHSTYQSINFEERWTQLYTVFEMNLHQDKVTRTLFCGSESSTADTSSDYISQIFTDASDRTGKVGYDSS